MSLAKNNTNYKGIPALTPTVVHNYLNEVGVLWTGKGVAVELGCWLGASTAALLEGLVEAGYDKMFYAFDKWKATKEQVKNAAEQHIHIKEKEDLQPMFTQNARKFYRHIMPYKSSIESMVKHYPGYPIEVVLFDAPKKTPVFETCMNALLPYFIPGVTIVGLLDYYFYKRHAQDKFKAPVKFIKEHKDCFEMVARWPGKCDCAFFKYIKEIK